MSGSLSSRPVPVTVPQVNTPLGHVADDQRNISTPVRSTSADTNKFCSSEHLYFNEPVTGTLMPPSQDLRLQLLPVAHLHATPHVAEPTLQARARLRVGHDRIILSDSKITKLTWQMSPCTPELVALLCSSAARSWSSEIPAHHAPCQEPCWFRIKDQLPVVSVAFQILVVELSALLPGWRPSIVAALPRHPAGPGSVAPLHLERCPDLRRASDCRAGRRARRLSSVAACKESYSSFICGGEPPDLWSAELLAIGCAETRSPGSSGTGSVASSSSTSGVKTSSPLRPGVAEGSVVHIRCNGNKGERLTNNKQPHVFQRRTEIKEGATNNAHAARSVRQKKRETREAKRVFLRRHIAFGRKRSA